jgi:hypothetical protein
METNSWKNSQIEFWQYRGCLMRFSDEDMEYLRGEKFSNGYCLPFRLFFGQEHCFREDYGISSS